MTLSWPAKFGDEVLDYEIDWTLALDGDEVTTVEAVGTGSIEVENISTTDGVTTLWVSGGGLKLNSSTRVNLLATTTGGRSIGASVKLPIIAR